MKNGIKKNCIGFISVVLLVLIDQYTKYLAYTYLKVNGPLKLWDGVFEFHYLTNAGAAWGMLSGQRIFFLVLTFLIMGFILYAYEKTPFTKKYALLGAIELLGLSGAIGNFIDRFLNGYVHDFIYFSLIDFPIFNVADCYVVVAGFLLVAVVLFVYKEDKDFEFLSLKRK